MIIIDRLKKLICNNIAIYLIFTSLLTIKTMYAYQETFKIKVINSNTIVLILILWHVIAFISIVLGTTLFIKKEKPFLLTILFLNICYVLFLYSNVIYYREFSNFITLATITSGNLDTSIFSNIGYLFDIKDLIYSVDIILFTFLIILVYRKEVVVSMKSIHLLYFLNIFFYMSNMMLVPLMNPDVFEKNFDNKLIVNYIGLDGLNYHKTKKVYAINNDRKESDENDLQAVKNHLNSKDRKPTEFFGSMKGRNVVYIHLESFQQFLIDSKTNKEVTPYLNSIYHSNDTLSFNNSFHQTGQGKTSDSELLIDNSLYGLPEGSAFSKYGGINTFNSAPNILKDYGYTSQVFHGNNKTFWNRNNVYKSFGYDMFYSLENFKSNDLLGFGLKDEYFFEESFNMYQEIKGLKYSKFIPVTNHVPYLTEGLDIDIQSPNTGNDIVDNYFLTANYTDIQISKFMENMSKTEEFNNTLFIFYGDHFGITNDNNNDLNKVINFKDGKLNEFDALQLERVPLMFYAPNSNINPQNKINEQLVGQIDILPTLLDLLGIKNDYVMFGESALSNHKKDLLIFRNGNYITSKTTYIGGKLYDNDTGELLSDTSDELTDYVSKELTLSDKVLNLDLLKFKYDKNKIKESVKGDY